MWLVIETLSYSLVCKNRVKVPTLIPNDDTLLTYFTLLKVTRNGGVTLDIAFLKEYAFRHDAIMGDVIFSVLENSLKNS